MSSQQCRSSGEATGRAVYAALRFAVANACNGALFSGGACGGELTPTGRHRVRCQVIPGRLAGGSEKR